MNSIFLGDTVTLLKEVGDDMTYITGKVTGIVTNDETGRIKYVTVKGIEQPIWLSDGWKFVEETEYEEDEDA